MRKRGKCRPTEQLACPGLARLVLRSPQGEAGRAERSRGFTLIELLVVIAIIAILAGLLLPAITQARVAAQEAEARVIAKSIEGAVLSYLNSYGKFPEGNGPSDKAYTAGNKALAEVLLAENDTLNPKKVLFLEISESSIDTVTGDIVDPWGDPFKVIVDSNFDGTCDGAPAGGANHKVVVWSQRPGVTSW